MLAGFAAICCLASLTGCDTPQATTAQSAPTTFSGLYFTPTNGRVGYHMVSNNYFPVSPCREDEHISVDADVGGITVKGQVPPGLAAPDVSVGRFGFEGTPRQAGDWEVEVTLHDLYCNGSRGPRFHNGRTWGDRTTMVHFHIDP